MHAYLITGNSSLVGEKVDALIKKNKLTRRDFPLVKIADVRDLSRFTRLTLTEPTAVVIEDFDGAGEEAQNAFLKNLEEPQENLTYILTANSPESVLPTIASRCQIIEAGNRSMVDEKVISTTKNFLAMSQGERLLTTSKITTREDAIEFMKNLILGAHSTFSQNPELVEFITQANKTLKALEANGNVQLQLTSFIVTLALF